MRPALKPQHYVQNEDYPIQEDYESVLQSPRINKCSLPKPTGNSKSESSHWIQGNVLTFMKKLKQNSTCITWHMDQDQTHIQPLDCRPGLGGLSKVYGLNRPTHIFTRCTNRTQYDIIMTAATNVRKAQTDMSYKGELKTLTT